MTTNLATSYVELDRTEAVRIWAVEQIMKNFDQIGSMEALILNAEKLVDFVTGIENEN